MAPGRARVLSFISQWGGPRLPPSTNVATSPADDAPSPSSSSSPQKVAPSTTNADVDALFPEAASTSPPLSPRSSPRHRPSRSESYTDDISQRRSSRPLSMIQTYHPPVMALEKDTLPELMPIFTYLNSHSNKLYQEGYFLMLHDLDTRGRPSPNREWSEVFAQLSGTVVSLWDAAQLDVAGADGEVIPTFINLADASIKMIPSLPMTGSSTTGQTLQNVLSVSTAANNRYLLHFNSLNSLTQWTSGIRLAMYEHTALQEAYTGSLIAGKGKTLNNIRDIMERTRMKHEDWARVRFGAGTPWRRCWCVVNPPDEKEYAKLQKTMKKRGAYDKSQPVLKGDIRFYETKKVTKRTRPIATITEAYSAYAIYPQSKPLIDQSTLVKIEGQITIHSKPESTTEGFVFVMPESHPAVSGFEIMMRFLFPVFDTFALYGRPNRLVAEPLDTRGLMFGMPKDRRYGYLELWDVASLILKDGSKTWNERQWRKQMKELTSTRMTSGPSREQSSTTNRRNTLSGRGAGVRFNENGTALSQPSTRRSSPSREEYIAAPPRRTDSAPPISFAGPKHQRSISESQYQAKRYDMNGRTSYENPSPPRYLGQGGSQASLPDGYETGDEGVARPVVPPELEAVAMGTPPPTHVAIPPAMTHKPTEKPTPMPHTSPELRRATSNVDSATLQQMADASNAPSSNYSTAGAAAAWKSSLEAREGRRSGDSDRSGRLRPDQRAFHQDQLGPRNNRLPTIPASPFIEQSDPTATAMANYEPTAPSVPEHGVPQEYQDIANTNPLGVSHGEEVYEDAPSRPLNNPGVQRKPVPGRSPLNAEALAPSAPTSSSLNSLRSNVIEPEALDRLGERERVLARAPSYSSSNYDNQSLASTDYASTDHASMKSTIRKPVPAVPARDYDRPRTGVLRTVGQVEAKPVIVGDMEYGTKPKTEAELGMPTIDFGPTYALKPEPKSRPGTSGTMMQSAHDRSRSRSRERLSAMGGAVTPDSANRLSYFGGGSPGQPSPNDSDPALDKRRSVIWQPGMGTSPAGSPAGHQSKPSLSAEEWVQQRAIAASQPHLPPRVSPASGQVNNLNGGGFHPTGRAVSGDWSQLTAGYQRNPTDRVPLRPHSRGASVMLNPQGLVNTESAKLSAREQEYVARATGTPLIELDQTKQLQRPKSSGLVGAIEAREREKRDILQSRSSSGTLVQNALQQRQQQMLQQQQHAMQQHMRANSLGNMSMLMQQNPAMMNMGVPVQQQPFSPQPFIPPYGQGIQQKSGSPSLIISMATVHLRQVAVPERHSSFKVEVLPLMLLSKYYHKPTVLVGMLNRRNNKIDTIIKEDDDT
ncbi:hypothetical protein EJ05DRAFT_72291 [Pseudovirgaria hyperparasitica]|uniref:PH domain-containing protein n=1 Tax=Pseudovirgaria hyperparasitica TaxID=470096 RepID=A0A6A6W288_9PEZI|nr:uncharacterized protein EJ05DRAFT_72291 [Pseudovirgaria hyperparasitica]KAF2756675.1 hypothetical protein EJ05DRAFT_72291 [Pseudovirgaria hyperparasitica]